MICFSFFLLLCSLTCFCVETCSPPSLGTKQALKNAFVEWRLKRISCMMDTVLKIRGVFLKWFLEIGTDWIPVKHQFDLGWKYLLPNRDGVADIKTSKEHWSNTGEASKTAILKLPSSVLQWETGGIVLNGTKASAPPLGDGVWLSVASWGNGCFRRQPSNHKLPPSDSSLSRFLHRGVNTAGASVMVQFLRMKQQTVHKRRIRKRSFPFISSIFAPQLQGPQRVSEVSGLFQQTQLTFLNTNFGKIL